MFSQLTRRQEGRDASGNEVLGVCTVDVNSGAVQLGVTPPGPPRIALETILVSLNPGELLIEKSFVVWLMLFLYIWFNRLS